jgi:hypothetical protein
MMMYFGDLRINVVLGLMRQYVKNGDGELMIKVRVNFKDWQWRIWKNNGKIKVDK